MILILWISLVYTDVSNRSATGMIEPRDSQQIWNEMSLLQYCLSHF
jgi:hypothetical protein